METLLVLPSHFCPQALIPPLALAALLLCPSVQMAPDEPCENKVWLIC